MDVKKMIADALNARQNSYSVYSGFRVGACIAAYSGKYYTGCNIENASYGATVCAERVALFKAVSEGERNFEGIAIVGGKDATDICPPCGICRQVLTEFCGKDFKVVLAKSVDEYQIYKLEELLPLSFGQADLRK